MLGRVRVRRMEEEEDERGKPICQGALQTKWFGGITAEVRKNVSANIGIFDVKLPCAELGEEILDRSNLPPGAT